MSEGPRKMYPKENENANSSPNTKETENNECKFCNKHFKSNGSLKVHIKRIHKGLVNASFDNHSSADFDKTKKSLVKASKKNKSKKRQVSN